jgi:hypothetical protein
MDTNQQFIHDVTMELLTSSRQYEKNNERKKECSRPDRKFYKKRIIQLVKDLILARDTPTQYGPIPNSVQESLDIFVLESVKFLKTTDMCDINQTKYVTLCDPELSCASPSNPLYNDPDDSDNMLFGQMDPQGKCQLEPNIPIPEIFTNLDNFVIRTPISPIGPPKLEENEDEFNYARTKIINLRSPQLKLKGVRKKKAKLS